MKETQLSAQELPESTAAADFAALYPQRVKPGEDGEVPFTQLGGEERRLAARKTFKRLHEENRDLMERLSRR